MEINANDAERTFAALYAGLGTFVMNQLGQAESVQKRAIEEITKLRAEVKRLKDKYEPEEKEDGDKTK